jgi:hypothetical protein
LTKSEREEIKKAFGNVLMARPGQEYEEQTLDMWREDWLDLASQVGMNRFIQGVKRARVYCKFFPLAADISELLPGPRVKPAEEVLFDLRDCERRKKAGEKFYTIGDVLEEVARRINTGRVNPTDKAWGVWAGQHLKKVAEFRKGK